jgi:oleate hydratase
MAWLKDQGVRIQYDTIVSDFEMDISGETQTTTAILCRTGTGYQTIKVGARDLVFVTLGSMVEDTAFGNDTSVPKLRVNEADPDVGVAWKLWQNLARKSASFGRPNKFFGDVPKTTWESATLTCKPSPLVDKIKEVSVNDPYSGNTVTGGIITFTDSAWLMSLTVNRQPHFVDQPKDVIVPWVYALLMDKPGDYVKKPMPDCTGVEILTELCFHLGLIDQVEEVIAATKVRTALMPYITAQFMPRARGDRPWPVPQGSTNLACLGQFVETHNDVVFTLESSVRTARIGVYSLVGIKKQVPDIYPGQYDIRRLLRATRTLNNDQAFLGEGLLRRLLGGTYFENILPLGKDEVPADLRKHSLFEEQMSELRAFVQDNHTLDIAKTWVQGMIDTLRGRR